MATNNFNLEQPEYLSDGETGINDYKANFAKIDNIFSYIAINRLTGEMAINRLTGYPVLNRLAVAQGG